MTWQSGGIGGIEKVGDSVTCDWVKVITDRIYWDHSRVYRIKLTLTILNDTPSS